MVAGVVNLAICFPSSARWTFIMIYFIPYFSILICILSTLLLRLYFTFKDSIFEITQYQKWILGIVFGMIFFGYICSIILIIFFAFRQDIYEKKFQNSVLSRVCVGIIGFSYFGLTVYGMVLFAGKMYKLASMRASSLNVGGSGLTEFNEQQRQLLYTTTKYVTLLSIAIISTWINVLFFVFVNIIYSPMMAILTCLDIVINPICLWLQYKFAEKYYDRYCKCFGKCCMYLLMVREKRRQKRSGREEKEENDLIPGIELNNKIVVTTSSSQQQQDIFQD